MPTILVVDDDPHIRDVTSFAMEKAGHRCVMADTGRAALEAVRDHAPDLIVLDVGIPEMDGLDVCRTLRKTSDVPILFLSARDDEIDRIVGLEIGGDDYVTKPFSPREVVARVAVILKRRREPEPGGSGVVAEANEVFRCGALTLDATHRSANFGDASLALTSLEFDLVRTLIARPRQTFTRDQLMTAAYPANIHVSDRTIDSHVRNVRAKFLAAGCTTVIETVHGFGFRLGDCRDGA
ncbi:MAG: response regulator transcription factor [Pseudomonadota bacterium]